MSVKKINNDVESYIDEQINHFRDRYKSHKGSLGPWPEYQNALNHYTDIWNDSDLWEESKSEPKTIRLYLDKNNRKPWTFPRSGDLTCFYLFQNSAYLVKGEYTDEQESLLVQAEHDKERTKFEKLKRKFELANSTEVTEATGKPKRRPIPESVRIAVWRRDQGTCVKCGSRRNLEYDHIIPVVEGGGDTTRNIELLCETCNRSKGAKIQ